MVCIHSTGLRPVIVRYGKHNFKKKRKNIPSHFATQKKGGASALSKLKMRTYGKKGGSTGFMRRIKPYTKIKRKKKKGGKRPKRVSPYTRGGELFNVWASQARARERRDKRLKGGALPMVHPDNIFTKDRGYKYDARGRPWG